MSEIMKFRKNVFKFLILVSVTLMCAVGVSASEPTFCFALQVDGNAEKQVSTGDIITVVFTLERTDSTDSYTMYAMQNEIRYDSTFLELVEDSFLVKDGVVTNDMHLNEYEREFYMNFLSMSGGTDWNAKTNVGSFQMRVIGTSGASLVSSQDCGVSYADGNGSYPLTASDVVIIVSDDCSVIFDSNGGSAVPLQTVKRNSKAVEPIVPVRDGYTFTGWYTDIDCESKWDFSEPINYNLRLYAGWERKAEKTDSLPFTDISTTDWYYNSVCYVYNNGLMNGVTDTAFTPDTATSRAMLVTILWRMEGSPVVNYFMQFEDVLQEQWYTEAIRWAASTGIVNGYSNTKFGVNDSITREQMATILYRYAISKGFALFDNTYVSSFGDAAKVSTWAYDALNWSVGNGLIQGVGNNTLNPQGTATRAQTATILMRFCEAD